jgi:gas vesicle protein
MIVTGAALGAVGGFAYEPARSEKENKKMKKKRNKHV